MHNVNIVRLGNPQVNIERLIQIINKNQNRYSVSCRESIPNLGNSDLNDFAYSDKRLFTLLKPHIHDAELTIGITSVPLEHNWFLRPNDDRSAIIITIFEVDSLIANTRKTIEDYLVYQVLISILTSEYSKRSGIKPSEKLLHDDCRGCLFDFCGNKEDLVIGLKSLNIDTQCRGVLIEGNVPEDNIDAALSVLKYMRKPNLSKSFYSIKAHPFLSMLFGIGVGITINIFSDLIFKHYKLWFNMPLVLLLTLGFVPIKYLYDVLQWRKNKQ